MKLIQITIIALSLFLLLLSTWISSRPSLQKTDPVYAQTQFSTTTIALTIYLHGVGNSGDVLNPTNGSLSNKNLLYFQRNITVFLSNDANQLVLTKTGFVSYNHAAGNFIGSVDLGKDFISGDYKMTVHIPGYLRKRAPEVISIRNRAKTTVPPLSLTAGDFNNDNRLNVADYNFLIDCYKDFLPARFCDTNKTRKADLSGEGSVNILDYNLFLREITSPVGD